MNREIKFRAWDKKNKRMLLVMNLVQALQAPNAFEFDDIEVIGNIYENPELLEEK